MSAPSAFRLALTLASTAVLAACGGSKSTSTNNHTSTGTGTGAAVTCDTLTPNDCGGDPSGSWTVGPLCGTATVPVDQMLPSACAGTMLTATPGNPSGTASFTSGSYQLDATIALDVSAVLTPACMSAVANGGDVGTTCVAIGPASASQGLSLTCAPQSGGGCSCSGSLLQRDQQSGSYAVSGNQLTLTPDASGASTTPTNTNFCVRNDSLIIKVAPLASGSEPLYLVFTKA
jgi:hypothetical protein